MNDVRIDIALQNFCSVFEPWQINKCGLAWRSKTV